MPILGIDGAHAGVDAAFLQLGEEVLVLNVEIPGGDARQVRVVGAFVGDQVPAAGEIGKAAHIRGALLAGHCQHGDKAAHVV